MAEETLSQAAIDALLAGHVPPEKPKAAAPPPPPPPPPEPKPAPKPEKASAPAPRPREEPAPVVAAAAPPPAATPTVDLTSIEEAIAALSKRIERLESLAGRMESIERAAKTPSSKGPDADLVRRVEALEGSVITICQIQQEAKNDPSTQKIALLQQQLAKVNNAVQALSSQLQALAGQVQKTASQNRGIVRKLGATMGYNLQNTYECRHCGSRGYVVTLVKCSACGEEDWWGWWPPEDVEEEMDEFGTDDEYAAEWGTADRAGGEW